jgi:large subunit ribosomal protein L22e
MAPRAAKKISHKFVVDASAPAADKIFDDAAFEKYLHDRIKVDGKTGNLAGTVTIARDSRARITVSSNKDMSKRYIKYLTKKFLKKSSLRDWLRVVASDKNTFKLKYFNVANNAEEEDEE